MDTKETPEAFQKRIREILPTIARNLADSPNSFTAHVFRLLGQYEMLVYLTDTETDWNFVRWMERHLTK